MRRYPLLVKVIHGKTALVEDSYGMYDRIVQEWDYDSAQFYIVTCDKEFCDIEESCATSEGADSMIVLGHLDCEDLEPLGKYLLKVANQNHNRNGQKCPKCGYEGGRIEVDGIDSDIFEMMFCGICGIQWINYYRMYDQQIE